MPIKFHGTIEELKYLVKSADITGNWSVDRSGKHTFRSTEGGVLNWWTNGTVNFQGKDYAQLTLQRSLVKYLSTIPDANCDYVDAEYGESVLQQHQLNNAADSCDNLSLLLRVIEILTTSGYAANKINDSTYVVSDSSSHSHCFLHQKLFNVLLPE
jgi:hypothetical protein